MNRRIVIPLLAVATLVIAIENWLYFSGPDLEAVAHDEEISDPASADEAFEASGTPEAGVPAPPLLGVSTLASLLASFDALRSPFMPAGEESVEGFGIPNLAGLLIGAERRIAWLGDHARSEGELYDGFTVARIDPTRVVLEREGRRFSLWLNESGRNGEEDPNPALDLEEEKKQ